MSQYLAAFVDSDVIISSLISEKGAARLLVGRFGSNLHISNYSHKELEKVVARLSLNQAVLAKTIQGLKLVKLKRSLAEIKKELGTYVSDLDDTHVVAGAVKAKARFLVTYNQKHYQAGRIKRDLGILVVTPAVFLQYLRSRGFI